MRFSVIMPVYNVEKYLEMAVNSVLAQTFSDFELILVEDASPDNCAALCDSLAERDKRIKVIHNTVNSGLGGARNTGLSLAQGKFILFMDSDDTILPDTLKNLNNEIDGYDITVFGINRLFEDKNGKVYKTEQLTPCPAVTKSIKDSGQLLIELNKAGVFPFAWNKAYSREFLLNCNHPFENTKLIEDFLFNVFLFGKSEKIKVIDSCLYNYRKPAHQTLANSYSPDFLELSKRKFSLEKELLKNAGADCEENLQFIYYVFIKHLLSYFVRNRAKSAKLSAKEQKQLIKNALNDQTVTTVLSNYKPSSLPFKIITFALKNKNISLCYLMAAAIDTIKN
jgi:glycosyltransferase involved in cell wall biosynthesis